MRSLGDPRALAELLQPIIGAELATTVTLETIMHHQDEPGYVGLYQAAKTTKQASVEQMVTLLRMAGEQPTEDTGALASILKLQTLLLQKVGTTMTLRALRLVEEDIVVRYREAHARLDGFAREALTRPFHRAVKRWTVIVAHLLQRKGGDDPGLVERLPLALSRYFASTEDRVCLRCLLDRRGLLPSIERRDPRPYQYLCGACHDEVLSRFPPDLLLQSDRWPAAVREDRVVERAIGRPEKLRAEKEVLAVLSGLPPDVPTPAPSLALAGASPPDMRRGATADQPPSVLDLPRSGAAEAELAYSDLLFDFRSVRASW